MARTRDDEKFEAQRRAILRAAERLFAEAGFHATSTADLCAAAGMSPGRLYHYFPSKQAIVEALVAAEREEATALFEPLIAASPLLPALADAVAESAAAVVSPAYGRLALEILAEAARNEAVMTPVREASEAVRRLLVDVIRRGQERGELTATVSPDDAARLLLALLDGAIGREIFDHSVTGAEFAALVRAFVLGWLATDKAKPVTRTERSGR